MRSQETRLTLKGLTKAYPTIVANDDIHLSVEAGEIHAVLGENGAGKSTLMKMIYGVTQPTAGEIFWKGQRVSILSPAMARRLGIGMVFQHFSLFESLTVAENASLSLGNGESPAQAAEALRKAADRYNLEVHPEKFIHDLSVGERQRVEILRCLLQDPQLLILDEPTSVLPPQAVEGLFAMLRRLASEGCSILYISHKLQEIQALCHRATILRGGRVVAECVPQNETAASLAALMIGRQTEAVSRPSESKASSLIFTADQLSLPSPDPYGTHLQDITIRLRAGSILGIAGVSGNGQRELLWALAGETPVKQAQAIRIDHHAMGRLGPAARRRLGLCVVPEDRLGTGAVPEMTLEENGLLTGVYTQNMVRHGLIDHDTTSRFAQQCIEGFDVRCSGPKANANALSGGNLQKFIVGRELLQRPRVLVCSQPTWGVDVGAAALLRQAIRDLADQGAGVILISEDLDEIFELSDEVSVLFEGRLSEPLPIGEVSPEGIGLLMAGVWSKGRDMAAGNSARG
jgi:general nucleoside transport system ATP-binding protein